MAYFQQNRYVRLGIYTDIFTLKPAFENLRLIFLFKKLTPIELLTIFAKKIPRRFSAGF